MALVKPVPAPRCDKSDFSIAMHVIADISAAAGDVDLAQQALKPAWAAQRTQFFIAAGGAVVITEERSPDSPAETFTVKLPAAQWVSIDRPIRTIVKAGSGAVQVVAEWWDGVGSNAWNGTVP